MDGFRPVVLIPAHREEGTIRSVVERAVRFAPVLVVDDSSPDETARQAESGGAMVIRNSYNLGYEGTLNRLFDEALQRGFTHAITLDADGEHDPHLLPQFLQRLQAGTAVVLGVRPHKQRLSEVVMGWYIFRRFGIRDILCGMKGYDLSLVEANGRFDTSQSIGTELALNSIRRGARFAQVAVRGTPRVDAPRFDKPLNANLRILIALWRAIRSRGEGVVAEGGA